MKRFILHVVLMSFFATLGCLPSIHADAGQKRLIIIADWSTKGPDAATVKALKKYPALRITIAWPAELKPGNDILALALDKRIEPALCLNNEPVLPMLFDTKISSPVAVEFSWPQDIDNIIFRHQEEFRQNWPSMPGAQGLHLRSGAFSTDVILELEKLGINWVTMGSNSGLKRGAYRKGKFLILAPSREVFVSPDEFWKWVASIPEPVVVMVFDGSNNLSPEWISFIGSHLKNSPAIETVVPSQLIESHKELAVDIENNIIASRLDKWASRTDVIQSLANARRAIERYKNSGQAQLKKLDLLLDDIYKLYSYDLLARLQKDSSAEDERAFSSGIHKINSLAGMPGSDAFEISADLPYHVLVSSGFDYYNAFNRASRVHLESFGVYASSENITYSIGIGTSSAEVNYLSDIYIDLNNIRGAGFGSCLPGIHAAMRPEDGWEFAIRIRNTEALLYRSGRTGPMLIKKYKLSNPREVNISKDILRGNPLKWGYQVIVASVSNVPSEFTIEDYLRSEENVRQNDQSKPLIYMPFIRID